MGPLPTDLPPQMSGQGIPWDSWRKLMTELQYTAAVGAPEALQPHPSEATGDLKASWAGPYSLPTIGLVSPRDLLPHAMYYTNVQPQDGDIALGKFRYAPSGVCKIDVTGKWWFYVVSPDASSTNTVPIKFFGLSRLSGLMNEIAREQDPSSVGGSGNLPFLRSISKAVTGANTATVGPTFAVPPGMATQVLSPGIPSKITAANTDYVYLAGNQTCPSFDNCIPLAPGNYVTLQVSNWSNLWFLSPTAAQRLIFSTVSPQQQGVCS